MTLFFFGDFQHLEIGQIWIVGALPNTLTTGAASFSAPKNAAYLPIHTSPMTNTITSFMRRLPVQLGLIFALTTLTAQADPSFTKVIDPHPNQGNGFGSTIVPLSTGNVVVISPNDDTNGTDSGAIYLFNGATGALISELHGSKANDLMLCAVIALANGNYILRMPFWDNGAVVNAGAVTWGSGTTGVSGTISDANSLVGSSTDDKVGFNNVTALPSGNYVVNSSGWSNAGVTNAGAVTWGNGMIGVSGVVSATNSLVGTAANDNVGGTSLTVLTNGNYVVRSIIWNGRRGAITWVNGTTGLTGAVSASNSLVGSTVEDKIGFSSVTTLSNGHYVVSSPDWTDAGVSNAGAVTWCDGTTGLTGTVSSANSLVGSSSGDRVGDGGVTALSNGNYVVSSWRWTHGVASYAGAVTWGSGTTGISGVVSTANSLVGTASNDQVGSGGVKALTNGHYAVLSPSWDNGAVANVGAATWCDGTAATSAVVSPANSLIGSTANDQIGAGTYYCAALTNGNYVVGSPNWDNGAASNAGAVTWCVGTATTSAVVSPANSLVGSTTNDNVSYTITELSNGNYVVCSSQWDNGAVTDAGAVTWGNGTTGISGVISDANSLVGGTANNFVGTNGIVLLTNGNYIVRSEFWDDGVSTNVGAATWGSGTSGVSGVVSTANSLVGSHTNDNVGSFIQALSNGHYVVTSYQWDNGAVSNAGAATWGNGSTGTVGIVSAANSLVGGQQNDSVGSNLVTLANGNYVTSTANWRNSSMVTVGAVTWSSGASGIVGLVTTSNSATAQTSGYGVGTVVADNVNGTIYAPFTSEGVIRVGSQATGFVPDVPLVPTIAVSGKSTPISSGDNTPSTADDTDFGTVALLNTQVTHLFTIANSGNGPLGLTGNPKVQLNGSAAQDFKVTRLPLSPVAANGSTIFAITFDPTLPGERSANVSIASDDAATNPYSFTIKGTGGISVKLKQTITFAPPTVFYLGQGSIDIDSTVISSSGLKVNIQPVSVGSTNPSGGSGGVTFTAPGTVVLKADQAGDALYLPAASVTRTLIVKAAPTALTLTNLAQTYNGTPRPISAVGGVGSPTIEYKQGTTYGPTAPTNAGSYSVRATSDGVTKTGTLVIAKAPVVVTPDDKRKFAGQMNPAPLTAVYTGFKGTDTDAVILPKPTFKTTATTASAGGLYPITASGGTALNYNFIYRQGTLVVDSFAGTYEALLVDGTDVPVGKLSLTVAATSKSFTGKLYTATESAALSLLSTTLTMNPGTELATGSVTVTKAGIPYVVSITLPLYGDVIATVTRNASPLGTADDGRKLSTQTVLYGGAHTAVLEPATPLGATVPVGAGWATASISTKGVMTLTGKLGDGIAFTQVLTPDVGSDPGYRLFVQPYKTGKATRPQSYLAGAFSLPMHPTLANRRYLEQATLTWNKTSLNTDTSYRTNFGPVSTVLMIDPWLPPVAAKGAIPAIPLATRLGLTGSSFAVEHSATGSALNGNLPTRVGLSTTNLVSVQLPVTAPIANSTKWKTTLVPSTGTFTGSFELADTTPKPRVVTFSGVLRQPATTPDTLIGDGHYLLPPLSGTEKTTGEVLFKRP